MVKIYSILFVLLLAAPLFSQDFESVKDPPLFERLPGFTIYDYTLTDFGAYRFCDENGNNLIVEGQISYYYYECEGEIDPHKIVSKFGEAVKAEGGKIYGNDPNQKFMVYKSGDITTWVDLFAEDFYYTLNIIRKAEKLSKIEPGDLKKSIDEKGYAILYFNFDRAECVLKEECKPVIDMIAGTIKLYPGSQFELHSYTDNIGISDNNLRLSLSRAQAIAGKLAELGIDESLLSVKGFGEEDPLADNQTVEGRALNNRIVLIKK